MGISLSPSLGSVPLFGTREASSSPGWGFFFVSKQAASLSAKCVRYVAQPGAPKGWRDLRRKIIPASPTTGHCRTS
jgi:hypothetical protein